MPLNIDFINVMIKIVDSNRFTKKALKGDLDLHLLYTSESEVWSHPITIQSCKIKLFSSHVLFHSLH